MALDIETELIPESTFWRDRRVFVTGCTGFVGSWLTAALVKRGADVVGLIRDHVPQAQLFRSGTVNQVTTVNGELVDYGLLERVLADGRIVFDD